MRGILEAFSTVLRDVDPDGRAAEPIVFAAWKRSVDGALAEHVVPISLEKGRLVAAVSSETWRRNVADLGPALASKLNSFAGSQIVKFIEFRVDAAAVSSHREQREPRPAGPVGDSRAGLPEELRSAAQAIEDPQLRDQFLAAAAGSLTRLERRRQLESSGPNGHER